MFTWSTLRTVLFGTPLENERIEEQRLPKVLALPIFSSDALSSVAYGTQEILLQLTIVGAAGMGYVTTVSWTIIGLLLLVALSYLQTVYAYPNGGGSYVVARENISVQAGLLAAAALLTDYVLTVAVSIAAGVQQVTSFIPALHGHEVGLCLAAIAFITIANLHGVRESGALFAMPTYFFLLCMGSMLVTGILGPYLGYQPYPLHTTPEYQAWLARHQGAGPITGVVLVLLLLKAFASGCAALTGIEAISNGVQAFRRPASRNAAQTMLMMAALLAVMFGGVSWLAQKLHVIYAHDFDSHTVIYWVASSVFHHNRALVGTVLFSTALILLLAANTSFNGFPRLVAILAKDRYMPRQMANLGDRLVFSNGIILLGLSAGLLVIAFQGHTDSLIPLYAVGVFLSFTLSQTGMVRHWMKERGPWWIGKAFFNGLGAVATCVVLGIIIFEKTAEGAWVVLIIIPAMMGWFAAVHRHYERLRAQLRIAPGYVPEVDRRTHTVVVLIDRLHRGNVKALQYANAISKDVRAVRIELSPDAELKQVVLREWEDWGQGIPLVIIDSPYRSLVGPVVEYVQQVIAENANGVVTVVVPQFVVSSWWQRLLHANTAVLLKLALGGLRGVVVTNVRYWPDESPNEGCAASA